MDPSGKTALLTGATGGLGRAIATALAERGATLVLSSRKEAELTELAASLPGSGHRVAVSDLGAAGAAVALAEDAGQVDLLVANAGMPGTGLVEAYSADQLSTAIRVNLESPMQLARALVPAMRERGEGHLVFMASLAGKAAPPQSSVYSATKFGMRGFALSLREDLWDTGVGVSLVSPGFIRGAGMFHDSGAKDLGLGTSTPEAVAAAVITAIERNRNEIEVAPRRQRFLTNISHRYPEFAGKVGHRRLGKRVDIANQVAKGQTEKR